MGAPARTLIGGVGYRFTRDLSFGPLVIDRLRREPWPDWIELEDLSYAPIAIVQRWIEARPDRLILIGAVPRDDRPAGMLYRYRPTGILPDPDEIQFRVGEALTGVISMDNLLVLTRVFGALPRDVEVIEVEPADKGWGEGLSAAVAEAMVPVVELLREEARRGRDGEPPPVEALKQRDEIMQVLYWMEGEGLAPDVRPADLLRFIGGSEQTIAVQLEALRTMGYVEQTRNEAGRYRLSVVGRQEGRRRFVEDFAPLLRQGHGECHDPECDCHITGDPANCTRRGGT